MAWREITPSDIEAHLNAAEVADHRQHTAEILDPLPILIEDVTQLVRGYVGIHFPLGGPGVPDELRVPAIDLVIHRLVKRVTKGGDGDADRRGAAQAATQLLQAVAEGKFSIAADEESAATVAPSAGSWGSQPKFNSPPYPVASE